MAKYLKDLKLDDTPVALDFSPAGDFFAVGCLDEKVYVWRTDYETITEKKTEFLFSNHELGVIDVKFNQQGSSLAVTSLDSVIRIWNVEEGKLVSEIKCKPMQCWKLAFSPNGREIFTSGELGRIIGYDVQVPDETILSLKTIDIFSTCIAFSNNGKYIAIGNNSGGVYIYDLKDENKMYSYQAHNKMVRDIKFTADNLKIITVSDDQLINVYDLSKSQISSSLSGHKGNINSIDIDPLNKNNIITSSYDRTVKFWNINDRSCTQTLTFSDNIWTCKYSHDGKVIGAACDNNLVSLYKTSVLTDAAKICLIYDKILKVNAETKINVKYNPDVIIQEEPITLTPKNINYEQESSQTSISMDITFENLINIQSQPKFKRILQNFGALMIYIYDYEEPNAIVAEYNILTMIHKDKDNICYTFVYPDD